MDEKQIEQEYKKWKHQAAPQLWERIEGGLREHPEREKKKRKVFLTFRWSFIGVSIAVFGLIIIVPYFYSNRVFINEKRITSLETTEKLIAVPEDLCYFSEDVLGDTELLFAGSVTDIFFECDKLGRADKIVYQMNLEQVYYAQNYISGGSVILVKSPIVKTQGDEMHSLYQLQQNCSYLLPLCQKKGNWELVYPFAPQIQVMPDGAYLFHTGYISLINKETQTTVQNQEGLNDYFYDRMRLRRDDEFLSELVHLVKRKVQEKH